MKTLNDLFLNMLKDIYHAEKQVLRAMPRMAKQIGDEELKELFETHREETIVQIERLERVFELLDRKPRGEVCEAMQGLLEEAKEAVGEDDESVREAGLVAAGQAIEHYEIARYGTLRAWAERLGLDEAARLLAETLEEEKRVDAMLTELAERRINAKADSGADDEDEDDEAEDESEDASEVEPEPEDKPAPRRAAAGAGKGRSRAKA